MCTISLRSAQAFHPRNSKGENFADETMLGLFAQYSKKDSFSKKKGADHDGQSNKLSRSQTSPLPPSSSSASLNLANKMGDSINDSNSNSNDNSNNNSSPPNHLTNPQFSPPNQSRVLGLTAPERKLSEIGIENLKHFVPDQVEELKSGMRRWYFDVLKYDTPSLILVAKEALHHYALDSIFEIEETTLVKFLFAVSNKYRDNAFHNFFHASAVLHITFMMLQEVGTDEFLTDRDLMCCLVGALVHDVDHTGFNNDFERNSSSELAVTYNDKSILENHHAATTFRLLQNESVNIFKTLNEEDFRYVRKNIIAIILKTDMVNHFDMVKQMQILSEKNLETQGYEWDIQNDEDRLELSTMVVHAADLSNPTYPKFEMTKQWCFRVCQEFSHQAYTEKELGLEVKPYMVGLTEEAGIAKLQIGFVNYVILPLWKVMGQLFPKVSE